jgi:hypothetical protein
MGQSIEGSLQLPELNQFTNKKIQEQELTHEKIKEISIEDWNTYKEIEVDSSSSFSL